MLSLYHYELNPTYKNVVSTQLKILQPKHYEARDNVYEPPQILHFIFYFFFFYIIYLVVVARVGQNYGKAIMGIEIVFLISFPL